MIYNFKAPQNQFKDATAYTLGNADLDIDISNDRNKIIVI